MKAIWNNTVIAESDDTVVVENKDAAWYYPEVSELAKGIKGRVAFWKGVKIEE